MSQSIKIERSGATMLIRLNKPELRNAFDLEMRAELADAPEGICGLFRGSVARWAKIAIVSVVCIPGSVNWSTSKSP